MIACNNRKNNILSFIWPKLQLKETDVHGIKTLTGANKRVKNSTHPYLYKWIAIAVITNEKYPLYS